MTEAPTWSWKRALGRAGLALLAVLIVGLIPVVTLDVRDPEKYGEGLGRLAGFVAIGAFGMSYCNQTGRRRWALAIGFVLAALLLTVVGVIVYAVAF